MIGPMITDTAPKFGCFQVVIVKLKLDKDRRKILDRKAAGRLAVTGKLKGKHTEESVAMDTP